jgi:nucleoside-diphosphate-sugar epimerase
VNQRPLTAGENVRSIPGGVFDGGALDRGMEGCQAVMHLVGIIMERPAEGITFQKMHVEATRWVVEAAWRKGVQRFVQMSALGTGADAISDYHKTKWQAEELVRASGLDWTILRPSVIHGARGEFMKMLAGWAWGKKPPFFFMPYFGRGLLGRGGAGLVQPVFAEDVARAFVDCLENPKTSKKIYDLVGTERMTWPEMYRIASEKIVGKKKAAVGIPVWYAKLLTRVLPGGLLPFNRDQVVMSGMDNVGDGEAFRRDFGWKPGGFAETLAGYAGSLAEHLGNNKDEKRSA